MGSSDSYTLATLVSFRLVVGRGSGGKSWEGENTHASTWGSQRDTHLITALPAPAQTELIELGPLDMDGSSDKLQVRLKHVWVLTEKTFEL